MVWFAFFFHRFCEGVFVKKLTLPPTVGWLYRFRSQWPPHQLCKARLYCDRYDSNPVFSCFCSALNPEWQSPNRKQWNPPFDLKYALSKHFSVLLRRLLRVVASRSQSWPLQVRFLTRSKTWTVKVTVITHPEPHALSLRVALLEH